MYYSFDDFGPFDPLSTSIVLAGTCVANILQWRTCFQEFAAANDRRIVQAGTLHLEQRRYSGAPHRQPPRNARGNAQAALVAAELGGWHGRGHWRG